MIDYSDSDEVTLWEGKPVARRMLNSADIFFVPLSCLFIFGSALLILAPKSKAPVALIIGWSIASFYLLFGRFIAKYALKRATWYQLTNQRALVTRRGKVVRSQQLAGIDIRLSESISRKFATVSFDGDSTESVLSMSILAKQAWLGENTGLDFLGVLTDDVNRVRFFDLPLEEANRLADLVKRIQRS